MEEKDYTLKELSELFSVSIRTITRQIADLVKRDKQRVLVPFDIVNVLISRHYLGKLPTSAEQENNDEEYDVVEGFTNEEYNLFQKIIAEYPQQKEKIKYLIKDIEYHKKSAESHQRQMEMLLKTLHQRNLLEGMNNHKALIKNMDD